MVRRRPATCGATHLISYLLVRLHREPGGEYTKKLVIKNVAKTIQKVKYRLPKSKNFSMAFPETINLTAGLSKTLQAPPLPPPPPRAPRRAARSLAQPGLADTGELPPHPP